MRVGIGYDVHRLEEGRRLILGGVEIPFEKGLLGHSDADVLVHAIMDALLGAAALGDIGMHFPDTDEKYKGADSIALLQEVGNILSGKGYSVVNIDSVVVAQRPKLAPYMQDMKKNICRALDIEEDRLNIKATTTEKLGFEGRGEGMSAKAISCIDKL